MGRAFFASFLAGDPAARAFLPLDFRDPATRVAQVRRASARRAARARAGGAGRAGGRAAAQPRPPRPPGGAGAAGHDRGDHRPAGGPVPGAFVHLLQGGDGGGRRPRAGTRVGRALRAGVLAADRGPRLPRGRPLSRAGRRRRAPPADHRRPEPSVDPRISLAHRRLGPDVETALAELADALGAAPVGERGAGAAARPLPARAPAWPRRSPARWPSCSPTTACWCSTRACRRWPGGRRPLYRRVLDDHQAIAGALEERARALQAAGFDPQIPPAQELFAAVLPRRRRRWARATAWSGRTTPAGRAWSLAGTGRRVGDDELARLPGRRSPALQHLGAAAAAGAGHAVPDRRHRGRPGRAGLLRPAGPAVRSVRPAAAAGGAARALPLRRRQGPAAAAEAGAAPGRPRAPARGGGARRWPRPWPRPTSRPRRRWRRRSR